MKRGMLLLLLLCMPLVTANTDWMFQASSVEFTQDITQLIIIDRFSDFSRVASLSMNTTLFPRETTRQEIGYQYSIPNMSKIDEVYTKKWLLPQDIINFSVYSKIINKHVIKEVKREVAYPITRVTKETLEYTGPTEKINSEDSSIKQLASKLAGGESDLFRIASKIGFWIHDNITYSSEGETRDATFDAVWTLKNKVGACDELSGLYISLLRSLKIPARYVVGQAYSGQEDLPYQSHGWVEVFFLGHGWVPFDSAYGEFGYVDNSHIEYYDSVNLVTSPIVVLYDGSGINISILQPISKTTLINKGKEVLPPYNLKITPYKTTVGFGSYNYVEVIINNTEPYYVAEILTMSQTEGLNFVGDRNRYVLLGPNEIVKEYFVFQTPDNVSDRYFYTYPLVAKTLRNYEVSTQFQGRDSFEVISKERVDEILSIIPKNIIKKSISKNVILECIHEGGAVYLDEETVYNCSVENRGNTPLKNLKLCLNKNCKPLNLEMGELNLFEFTHNFKNPGPQDAIFILEGEGIGESYILSADVLVAPELSITIFFAPSIVSYKDKFEIEFQLNNTLRSPVKEVFVNISHEYFSDGFSVPSFKNARIITVGARARDLKVGENILLIKVNYTDMLERDYLLEKEVSITLGKLSVVQRIAQWIKGVFKGLDSLFE